ncbi:uncharacterized protein LOC125545010 [Triticum urartu]|uniref:uncharacterized protein LOC125545010 n=1 Tax=Triticum urartu TaxID=4572 RepID=UPI0020437839|nr:uncharacterized protein LOC125545010 [Triticum urartu]
MPATTTRRGRRTSSTVRSNASPPPTGHRWWRAAGGIARGNDCGGPSPAGCSARFSRTSRAATTRRSHTLEGRPPLRCPAVQWMPRRFVSGSSSSSRSSSHSSSHSSGSPAVFGVKAEPAAETPLGRRTRPAGIIINEGGGRASSSAPPRLVKPKTEPGLPVVKTEPRLAGGVKEEALDNEAALKWARDDWLQAEKERQCAALARFEARPRGCDEGGIVVLEDSDDDDDAPPPPVHHGDAGQGSSRGGRAIKKEKAADDDDDIGDFVALIEFFAP